MSATMIRPARKAAKLTLEELAERIGMSVSQLSRIETGKREPRLLDVFKIAKVLNVNPVDLINDPAFFEQVEVMPPSGPAHIPGRLDPEIVEFAAQRVVRRLMLQVAHRDDKDRAEDTARMIVQVAAQLQQSDDRLARGQSSSEREDAELSE